MKKATTIATILLALLSVRADAYTIEVGPILNVLAIRNLDFNGNSLDVIFNWGTSAQALSDGWSDGVTGDTALLNTAIIDVLNETGSPSVASTAFNGYVLFSNVPPDVYIGYNSMGLIFASLWGGVGPINQTPGDLAGSMAFAQVSAAAVPAPPAAWLLATGLAALAGRRLRASAA